MIITNAPCKRESAATIGTAKKKVKQAWQSYFQRIISKFGLIQNDQVAVIESHLSNTLGIITLMTESDVSRRQLEHIASLKSSCDNLLKELQIPLHVSNLPAQSVQYRPINSKAISDSKGHVLYISENPLQSKIIKNLLNSWGYKLQLLAKLPKDLTLLRDLDVDLIIISANGGTISPQTLQTLIQYGLRFMVHANAGNIRSLERANFPIIDGLIQPEVLKQKIERLLSREILIEAM